MSKLVRIDVLPDADGGWSVTRDRIVDAHFDHRDRAIDYAWLCQDRAERAGQEVRVEVHESLERTDLK